MKGILGILRGAGHEVKVVAQHLEKPAEKIAEIALEVMPMALPASTPIAAALSGILKSSMEGTRMNQLEAFAMTMIIGIVHGTVKNPAHKLALQGQLVGIADLIYASYGMVSPASLNTVVPDGTASAH